MDLYLAGAESPMYLRQLLALDVDQVAISFFEWQRRHGLDSPHKHMPDDVKVVITAGVSRKETIDWHGFSEDYLEFCNDNAAGCLVFDMDAPACPPDIRRSTRDLLGLLPNSVLFPLEDEPLSELAARHERIGINARISKSIPANELRRLPATLYGSNVADQTTLRVARFTATTTLTWLNGRRYGELWVFARNKMHHYTADALMKAVRVHARDLEAFGVDPVACMANDKTALTQAAVRSFQAMAQSLTKRPRDRQIPDASRTSANGGDDEALVNNLPVPVTPLSAQGANTVVERERVLVPNLSLKEQFGVVKVDSTPESLRQCDTCYLSTVCPKFEPEHACAFEMPVKFETDAQWEAALKVILEIQFQRIAFASYAEQLEGGGLNARLGQEMDRFLKTLGNIKELKTPVVAAGAGVMARLFGATFDEEDDDQGEEEPNQGDLEGLGEGAEDAEYWLAGEGQGPDGDDQEDSDDQEAG